MGEPTRSREALLARVWERVDRFDAVLSAEAESEAWETLEAWTEEDGVAAEAMHAVATLFWCRHMAGSTRDHANALILFRALETDAPDLVPEDVQAALSPPADQEPAELLAQARTLLDVFAPLTDTEMVARAVGLLRQVPRPESGILLGKGMLDLYLCTGDPAVLAEALDTGEAVLAEIAAGDPAWAPAATNVGGALLQRFGLNAWPADLERAEGLLRAAKDHLPALLHLVPLLETKAVHDPTAVQALVETAEDAVTALPPDDPRLPQYQRFLGYGHARRFAVSESDLDLDAGIEHLRMGLPDVVPWTEQEQRDVVVLCGLLRVRYERTHAPEVLDEAIDLLNGVGIPPDDRAFPYLAETFSSLCRHRYERTFDIEDLREAVRWRGALIPDAEAHSDVLAGLACTYSDGYLADRDPSHLTHAVDVARLARELVDEDSTLLGRRLYLLGALLAERASVLGDSADTAEAAHCLRAALRHLPPDDPDRADVAVELGILLRASGRPEHVERAIELGREVLATGVQGKAAVRLRGLVGGTLVSRASKGLGAGWLATVPADDDPDVTEAIAILRQAVDDPDADHAGEPGPVIELAIALRLRFHARGRRADLDASIDLLTSLAERTGGGNAAVNLNLAESLKDRASLQWGTAEAEADADLAVHHFRTAADRTDARPSQRTMAAAFWGRFAEELGRHEEALEGYGAAIGLLPLLAPRTTGRGDSERALNTYSGLADAAAAAAMATGRPERAVELLEQGRNLLWRQLLELSEEPEDLADVRPDLVTELHAARRALDAPHHAAHIQAHASGLAPTATERGRMNLALRWERAVNAIREVPGFDGYLRARSFQELAKGACDGPVVMVTLHRSSGHAFIISGSDVRPLPLRITTAEIEAHAASLASLSSAGHVDAQLTVASILEWLWTSIVEPVLLALGHDAPPGPGEPYPRLWWCPTGPLALFPLHAAGEYLRDPRTDRTALDRVVSSYTPSIGSLLSARSRQASDRADTLIVGVPGAQGGQPLPHVTRETALVQSALGDASFPLPGEGRADDLLARLPSHPRVHIACHGIQVPQEPSRSGIVLHDRAVTVTEIADLRLREADLAFLSACQTAAGGAIPDEAVHLAAALHTVGYRDVVGTLWAISDSLAPDIAGDFYKRLPVDGPRVALHHAVRAARSQHPYEPGLWAPYVHLGPG